MNIDIMTLFPDSVNAMMHVSILGRAIERGHIQIRSHQIRDYTTNKQMQVDDYPYGGGRGAVMQADPLYRCWAHIVETYGPGHTIFMSPCGRTFNQDVARELKAEHNHLILVCGHYEGIDQRFIDECVDEEISMGDFVLTAMAAISPPWRWRMRYAAWSPESCLTPNALKRSLTGTVCWSIPSIPAPPYGTTGLSLRSCSPVTTAKWLPGAKRKAISVPCAAGLICSPNLMKAN